MVRITVDIFASLTTLGGKAFSFSCLSMRLAVGFLTDVLYQVMEVPFYSWFSLEFVFIITGVVFLHYVGLVDIHSS